MRVFQTTYRDRSGKQRLAARWYVEFRGPNERKRRLPGFTDKRATEEMGRKLEQLVARQAAGERPDTELVRWLETLPVKTRLRLARIGLLDPRSIASTKPLSEHLNDYEQSLRDADATADYVKKAVARVKFVTVGIAATFLTDLSAGAVSRYLADRRAGVKRTRPDGARTVKKPLSARSSNHYLAACKSFGNWLVRERRLSENPLAHLSALNAKANRKHVRRALESDEVRALLAVTKTRHVLQGMTGENRYWLYRLAVETGLRSNELRSLTRASFNLNNSEPTVTIDAANAKNRRAATLPLRPDTAAELHGFIGTKHPTAKAFRMPRPENVVVALRSDLEAAGIPYADDTGRVVDFHALRVTCATLLLRSGVDIRTAKELMRHATIAMTADVYACTLRGSLADAVGRLPDLSTPMRETAVATGTDDADPDSAFCLARRGAFHSKAVRSGTMNTANIGEPQPLRKTGTYDATGRDTVHGVAPDIRSVNSPPRGFEPLSPA